MRPYLSANPRPGLYGVILTFMGAIPFVLRMTALSGFHSLSLSPRLQIGMSAHPVGRGREGRDHAAFALPVSLAVFDGLAQQTVQRAFVFSGKMTAQILVAIKRIQHRVYVPTENMLDLKSPLLK